MSNYAETQRVAPESTWGEKRRVRCVGLKEKYIEVRGSAERGGARRGTSAAGSAGYRKSERGKWRGEIWPRGIFLA